jgi:hypothetical protein
MGSCVLLEIIANFTNTSAACQAVHIWQDNHSTVITEAVPRKFVLVGYSPECAQCVTSHRSLPAGVSSLLALSPLTGPQGEQEEAPLAA